MGSQEPTPTQKQTSMKRLFTFLFALLSACTFSAYADIVEGTCGDNLTWTLNTEDGTLVIAGTGEMADYTVFSSAPWYDYRSYITYVTLPDGLTSIGGLAFDGCSKMTSVTIPNSVTSIGNRAFDGCRRLTSITIPNSVTSIGIQAFSYCSGLTFITLGNNVTSIGEKAFRSCHGLTSITIPNSVTSIGRNAFFNCFGLTSIRVEDGNTKYDSRENCNAIIETATNTLIRGCQNTIIPNSVTSIGSEAFDGCSSLTSITIPNSVTSIGYYAFSSCSALTSITIPNSVTTIEYGAFLNCYNLTSITIPNSVTSIGNGAFCGCSGLTSVTIPNSVTSIGGEAFYECTGLTSITIPNNVTSIGDYAFYNCSSLTSVTIPNSITSIGNSAFRGCSSLAVVNVEATTPPTLGTNAFTSSPTCNIPCSTLEVYQASDWQNFVGEFVEQSSDDSGDDGDMDKDLTIVFSDRDNNQISAQTVTLRVPVAPQIAGFTFLYWLPVAEPMDDVITLQAVYESNTPTAAPEVYVNPSNPAQKLIRNGQVYILHEEKMYTISGQVVK